MSNDMLMLMKLETDTAVRLSLTLSIVAVVVSLVSAIAAILAVFYSKRATSKGDDLVREEENNQSLEPVSSKPSISDTRTKPQEEQDSLQAQAQGVFICIEGEAMGEVPLELRITLRDPSVRVSRLERLSDAGNTRRSSPCKATDKALVFKSILAAEKMREWWDAGESVSTGEARCILRVYLLLDGSGREVHRDVAVSIVEGLRNVGIATLVVWTIKGSTEQVQHVV